jgi:hypothetical protein
MTQITKNYASRYNFLTELIETPFDEFFHIENEKYVYIEKMFNILIVNDRILSEIERRKNGENLQDLKNERLFLGYQLIERSTRYI